MFRPFHRRTKLGVTKTVRDNYTKTWFTVCKQVLARDDHKCQHRDQFGLCGSKEHVQVHHIIPLSRGGTTSMSNLVTLCERHHKRRHKHMK